MDESDAATSSTTSEPADEFELQFRQQGQLVIDGFESIRRKYGSSRLPPDQAYIQGPPYTLPIGRIKVESNVILLKELLSDLLPLLARQLGTLSLLLNPEEIRKDPGSNLMRLLELQPALHLNMTRVTNSIALISPRPLQTVDRVDDQELKRFKSYWLNELADDLIEIRFHVSCICYATCTDIEGLDLCMVYEFLEETGDTDPSVCKDFIEEAIDYINTAIKTVEGAYGMTRHLGRAIGSLGSSPDHLRIQLGTFSRQVFRKPVIRLTELLIPIIKLARLFFTKISRSGINRIQLPAYTEMNSKQIKCLCLSAHHAACDISKLSKLLYTAEGALPANPLDTRTFTEAAGTLAGRFEGTDLDYYKSWFAIWNTQFIVAVDHFQNLARSIEHIP
ncbi:hypothetical protein KEM48_009128 [Puccinia striiformis f. sp. tritici PST-130]|uniref:Uncharacterized protein n=1 Tax=Puccinia striiformis f. sp. tritici PST-78 TaxID=1165861 RepID=A0A0L0VI12_9BASI|nr:hypothetical protein KEM48_009128 [Puccinia striiformis f. sp. tritici PST-130]KNE98898.1 hypothetical protein PSTG_07745 [Puccinia striiformis f. sp. tritici PST-78]